MEFFPLAAVGIGMAIVGTVLLLFLVMLFRTRLTNANSRTMRTQPANNANNSHHHPLEKPNSLILTSGLTTTSATNNSSSTNTTSNMNSGYRALPQSKAEADAANPDIIPGANGKNFPATKGKKPLSPPQNYFTTINEWNRLYVRPWLSRFTNQPKYLSCDVGHVKEESGLVRFWRTKLGIVSSTPLL